VRTVEGVVATVFIDELRPEAGFRPSTDDDRDNPLG
jgi:hypothetical protein